MSYTFDGKTYRYNETPRFDPDPDLLRGRLAIFALIRLIENIDEYHGYNNADWQIADRKRILESAADLISLPTVDRWWLK